MLQISSKQDLTQINIENPAYPIIAELITQLMAVASESNYLYEPEADGCIALIEPNDTELCSNGSWEGMSKLDDFAIALFQVNNQYGIICVIPDTNESFINGIH